MFIIAACVTACKTRPALSMNSAQMRRDRHRPQLPRRGRQGFWTFAQLERRFYAGRCRSGAEGKSHAEARPFIALDQCDIGSLPSMRWADEHQIGRTSSNGVQEGKSHLSMQRMRLSENLCNEAELIGDPMLSEVACSARVVRRARCLPVR